MMTFDQRKAFWAKKQRKNNDKLPAGSLMFYYCRICGAEMIEPEDHIYPAPRVCHDCKAEGRKEAPHA